MLASSEECTGCFACLNACLGQCISPVTDDEGFLQPVVNRSKCLGCGKCETACPVRSIRAETEPAVYAAWSNDGELLKRSSSGGMFGVLARWILEHEGVVFGAAYNDDLSVSHVSAETIEELGRLHGSKYVQSFTGLTYQEAKQVLEQGRCVLYSGTPCQIAGLYGFLGKDYDGLYTCDVVCHGVPSPGVYGRYLRYVEDRQGRAVMRFEMRSKRRGWTPASSPLLVFSDGSEHRIDDAYDDPYLNGFLFNLYLRKPCYNCKYAKVSRESDLTLGDFWGIGRKAPFKHETKQGVSLLLVNTEKGERLTEECKGRYACEERALGEAITGNSRLQPSVVDNEFRDSFYKDYRTLSFEQLIRKYLRRRESHSQRFMNLIVRVVGVRSLRTAKSLLRRSQR